MFEIAKTLYSELPAALLADLEVALRATAQVAPVVCAAYQQIQAVEEKGHADYVTPLDLECDRAITDYLAANRPSDPVVSEELRPDLTLLANDRCWIQDPLDATTGFIFQVDRRIPSNMIALCERGSPMVAVVRFPLSNEIFYAVRGYGAYAAQTRIHCRSTPLSEAWVDMNQYGNVQFESAAFRNLRDTLRRPGGARLLTAHTPHSGQAIRLATSRPGLSAIVHDNNPAHIKQAAWDVMPPALILQEAGGVLVTLDGQEYNPLAPEPFIMATDRPLADEIAKLAS